MNSYVKIQVFIPKSHVDKIRLALGESGIGRMGDYDYTAFITEGRGYFRPLKGAQPAIGEVGEIEEVAEMKLEFVCDKSEINKVMEIIKENHPYEEVALDVLPLLDFPSINRKS